MLALIWVGFILSHLGLLKGWVLFWYIVSLVIKAAS
jgi:hypothetical protein